MNSDGRAGLMSCLGWVCMGGGGIQLAGLYAETKLPKPYMTPINNFLRSFDKHPDN